MKITKIIAISGVTCALFAAPAFAQSSATKAEDYAKDKVATEAKDAAKEMATDTAKNMMPDLANEMVKSDDAMAVDDAMTVKGDPLTIETSSGVITAKNGEMEITGETTTILADEIMTEPKMMDAPTAAPTEITTVVIACPSGTTAQDDGTCMITGDYAE